jgi:quercetin dioxygenase-like cupin family protein
MRRTVVQAVALAAVLALPFAAVPTSAQEATPAAEETSGLPPGVSLVELPQLTPFALPEEPGAVRVFWLILEPNAVIPTHDHPFSEFAVMTSGTAMFLTESGPAAQAIRSASAETGAAAEAGGPGVELTAEAGDTAIFPSGNRSDTRAGPEGATMLILEIVTAEGEATPAA